MKRTTLSFLMTLIAVAVLVVGTQFPLRAQTPAPVPAQQQATPNLANSPATASPSTAEDIRDIRGPKAVPSSELPFLWLAGGVALASLSYGAWRWFQHVHTAPRTPYEIALARLEKARALMTIETAHGFSIEVSEIVRSYIEVRFQVRATHQTTEEFLHNLLEPSDAMLANHQELLAEFLHHCDLAKFARWILSVKEMEAMHHIAHVFVVETGKPAPAAVTVKEPSEVLPEQQPALSTTRSLL